MTVHDFNKRLRDSQSEEHNIFLNNLYKEYFDDVSEITTVEGDMQRMGVDKVIFFNGDSRELYVEEKIRRKDYGNDILLELWSKAHTKRGWLYTSKCDYLVYYIAPAQRAYILPMRQLRLAWQKNQKEWEDSYGIRIAHSKAQNSKWDTINIPIPTEVLLEAIKSVMYYKGTRAF